MPVSIEPLKEDEVDEYIDVFWAAYEPLDADMFMPMVYPKGLQPEVRQRFRNRIQAALNDSVDPRCFCAKDSVSGSIVGISWWSTHLEPRDRAAAEQDFERASIARTGGQDIEGMNKPLDEASFRAAFWAEFDVTEGNPYVALYYLAVHPQHHRRGIGGLLLSHGLERFGKLGLPVFVHASSNGKVLYERHGFKVIKDFPFDARIYGGRSQGRHWCMLRPATN